MAQAFPDGHVVRSEQEGCRGAKGAKDWRHLFTFTTEATRRGADWEPIKSAGLPPLPWIFYVSP